MVELYSNGSATPGNTLTLSAAAATLADGDVLVIANASADPAILAVSDITSSVTFYNGDDAIALRRNGVIIDVIGVIGSDPGSQWGSGATTTGEHTLRRLASVCGGDVDGFDNPSDITDQWEGFPQNTFDGLGVHAASCALNADDLLFSEYIEGSSNNKALEIYNGTGASADLSEYVVELYSNGSATPGNTLTLSSAAATLADGDTLVIANSSADPAILAVADITSGVTFFNGDDALALRRNGVIIDVIGVIGSDPGSQWGSGLASTQDNTIRRLASVCQGDADGFDNPSDITDQWEGFAINTFDGLGSHSINCAVVVNAPVVIDCGGDLNIPEGDEGTQSVSASDADGVIASITITNINPAPGAGSITAGSLSGGSVLVTVSDQVPAGVYSVTLTAANNDATPQTAVCVLTVNVTLPSSGWVINEFLADPAGSLAGDANGDGVRDATQDEFVEIVNQTGSSQNIANWTISDGFGLRHTFPAGTVIGNNNAIVVFGGGTPTGAFGGAVVQVASTGALGLNNGGDTITFANDLAAVLAQVNYGGEGGGDQSLTLDPDLTGPAYVQHGSATGSAGALFSPGTRIDGTPFGGADDLFFSEYIEGSGNNKAIEIYNGATSAANLSEYVVELYSNGSASPGNTLTLSAAMPTLGPGEVLVIANSSASAAILNVADITSGVTFFNGDDALALRRNGDLLDVIGVIGSDPGSEWGTGDASTQNNTIRRLPSVCSGDPDGFDNPSDISNEWVGLPIDTFDGLGSHTADCGGIVTNQPVETACGDNLTITEGNAGTQTVTATDPDGVIDSIVITNIIPAPAAGSITIGPLTPGSPDFAVVSVSDTVPAGSYTVEISAANTDIPAQTATCMFAVNVVGLYTIAEIQGPGLVSPLAGQIVGTNGNIVTGVTNNGFYMQTPDNAVDADPNTSEGIFVLSNAPVMVGDEVNVSGGIIEFFTLTEFSGSSVSVTIVSSGNALPAAFPFDAITPSSTIPQPDNMERFECMRVEVVGAFASGPTNNFGDAAVNAGGFRSFREPGVMAPAPPGLPEWDGNPELVEVDPDGAGLANTPIFGGSLVDAVGPLGFIFGNFQIQPTELNVTPPLQIDRPVRDRQPLEFTVGSLNMLRLFRDQPSVTGYQNRLNKFSLQIRETMKSPDIIAFQEVESIEVLQDLAAKINADDSGVVYTAYLIEGNDIGGIDVGFLTRDTVQVNAVSQVQATDTFTFAGNTATLHDRPPLMLDGVYVAGDVPFPITVISVHNRSLSGIEDPSDGGRVRQKRFEQADRIAQFIQDLQTNDPDIRLVVAGDFNAFEFTDGYVDSMGIISGSLDPLGALLPGIDHVNPDLVNQTFTLPADERYSFNFSGTAQSLDHILTSSAINEFVVETQLGRGNADAPGSFVSDGSNSLRASDHDPSVLFIQSEADSDGDGLVDDEDACPNSDLSPTVVIDGCDSGVANILFADGCTISDLVQQCAAGASNHGQFVSCVSHLANDLKKDGIISGNEKGKLTSCAAKSDIP